MITYSEVVLSVSDYGSFDLAAAAIDDARKDLEARAAEQGVAVQVLAVQFLEFDSSNPSHAGAYFEVTFESDQVLLD